MNNLKRKATPWVTFSVLAGGLATSIILFFLVRIENRVEDMPISRIEEYLSD